MHRLGAHTTLIWGGRTAGGLWPVACLAPRRVLGAHVLLQDVCALGRGLRGFAL